MTLHALWTWLLTPLSGSAVHDISAAVSWHARCMVLAWAVLLPVGVLVARFYKITPKQDWPRVLDNKRWWHAHLASQSLGIAAAMVGVYLIYGVQISATKISPTLTTAHNYLGWSVLALGLLQVLGGVLRGTKGGPSDSQLRGDHYDMTRRRRVFEMLHKGAGYAALALAVLTVALGLVIADAPRWMPIVLAGWWLGVALAFVRLQRQGRCIDTYQAIWGDGLHHPGNAIPAAGWGSQRYCAARFAQQFRTHTSPVTVAHKGQS